MLPHVIPQMNISRYSKVLFLFAICIASAQVDDSKLLIPSTSQGKEEASKYAQLIQQTYDQGEYELSKMYSDSLFLLSELYGIKDMSIMALNGQAIYHKNKGDSKKSDRIVSPSLKKN